jgi:putative nucleotidyltransferase with HDIG domain
MPIAAQSRVTVNSDAIARALRGRGPLVLGRVDLDSLPQGVRDEQACSALLLALGRQSVCGGPDIHGVIALYRREGKRDFEVDDLAVATEFSRHASAALSNAQCYDKMRRRTVQFKNLVEINQSINSSLHTDIVLHSIVDRAVELLGCEAGSLLLTDPETRELVFKVAVGPAAKELADRRLPPGVGVAGAVARDGTPLIINNAKEDPRHYGLIDASTSLKTSSLLCVPLTSNGRVGGVVEVMNKRDGKPFDDEDRDLLTAFAIQGALALENARLYSDLRRGFADTVQIIANAIEAKDKYTRGHTLRVTKLALATARELGWSNEQIETLEIGALLHDIGKIGIPDAILHKPTELTEDEYSEMTRHPVLGAQMLENVAALRPMLPYVLYHQERFDGKGYPFGLQGNAIPLEGRILAVVDTFDAMTSNRPYRQGLSMEQALEEIERNRGTQFDPDVVDALTRALKEKPEPVQSDSAALPVMRLDPLS